MPTDQMSVSTGEVEAQKRRMERKAVRAHPALSVLSAALNGVSVVERAHASDGIKSQLCQSSPSLSEPSCPKV